MKVIIFMGKENGIQEGRARRKKTKAVCSALEKGDIEMHGIGKGRKETDK